MATEQTVYLRPPLWLPIVAVVIGGAFYVAGKNIEIQHRDEPGTITVSGEGKVFAAPDIGEVSFGVQTGRQPTAEAAMKKLADSMDKIYAAVQKEGVEKKDISTENFWLNPVYDWTDGGQVFRGFEATQSLRAKVRDLDKVSSVLTAATNAGANQAGNVSFTIDDPEGKRAEAREEAILEAKEKAKVLADQLNVELGKIRMFSEGDGGYFPPMLMRDTAMGMGGGDVAAEKAIPLPPGEQEIVVSVTITYELK